MASGGVKFDQGKPPLSLVPGEALEQIAQALAFGAKKYAPHNWRKGFAWSRLLDGCMRHLFAWGRGERHDPESGLSHLAHAGAMLVFLLTHEVKGLGEDDCYKEAPAEVPNSKEVDGVVRCTTCDKPFGECCAVRDCAVCHGGARPDSNAL